MHKKKRILCYGDSNTWGYTPGTGVRLDEDTRWTGILQNLLGADYQVIECGMNARTTSFDDPFRDYLNGRHALVYSLMENKPIDLLIISLGTNDLKYGGAAHSAAGLRALLQLAVNADTCLPGSSYIYAGPPRVLVISPIELHSELDTRFPDSEVAGKVEESRRFAGLYSRCAADLGAYFLDAAKYAYPSVVDCVHMPPEAHAALARAIYGSVRQIMEHGEV